MRWCRTYDHKLSKYLEGNLKQFRTAKNISGVFAKMYFVVVIYCDIIIILKIYGLFTSILQIWLVLATFGYNIWG